jgi:hypothetical protein
MVPTLIKGRIKGVSRDKIQVRKRNTPTVPIASAYMNGSKGKTEESYKHVPILVIKGSRIQRRGMRERFQKRFDPHAVDRLKKDIEQLGSTH